MVIVRENSEVVIIYPAQNQWILGYRNYPIFKEPHIIPSSEESNFVECRKYHQSWRFPQHQVSDPHMAIQDMSPQAAGWGPPSDVCGFINHEITPIN